MSPVFPTSDNFSMPSYIVYDGSPPLLWLSTGRNLGTIRESQKNLWKKTHEYSCMTSDLWELMSTTYRPAGLFTAGYASGGGGGSKGSRS